MGGPCYGGPAIRIVIPTRRRVEVAAPLDGAAAVRDVYLGHGTATTSTTLRPAIIPIAAVLVAAAIAALVTIVPEWMRMAHAQADAKKANEKTALQNITNAPLIPDVEMLAEPALTFQSAPFRFEFGHDPERTHIALAAPSLESSFARRRQLLFSTEAVGSEALRRNEASAFIRENERTLTDSVGVIRLPPARPVKDHYDQARNKSSPSNDAPTMVGSTRNSSFATFAWLKKLFRFEDAQSAPILPLEADSRTAVYDIKGQMVYLPNGEKLEAHSGLGKWLDDARYVNVKGQGPTPPNTYRLALREQPFHGVQAIRLIPVGGGNMYGRDGMLAHSYMLGPDGQSNGCVSLRDYQKFLQAFLRADINRLIVVARLEKAPSRVAYTDLTAADIVAH